VPGVDDGTWDEVRQYLKGNPEEAKKLQQFARNPDAMRGWFQAQAIAEHYHKKLESKDAVVEGKMKSMQEDPELAAVFEDIKANGMPAIMKYYQNEDLMLKISKHFDGIPQELQGTLKSIEEMPLSIHEAAKNGDLKAMKEYIEKKQSIDTQDQKGITPLGYAVGANRIVIVKMLLDKRANPFAVDSSGNSAMHYAAGYGRKELVEYLMKMGVSVGQANAKGQTPLTVAAGNKQVAVVEILKAAGANA
jgi:hypothetical protein